MSPTLWALLALAGIGLVYVANKLRMKRTDGCGCSGHFFVAASEMTTAEWLMNRSGIAVFGVGIIVSVLVRFI